MAEHGHCPYCYRSCYLGDGEVGVCKVIRNRKGFFTAVESQRCGALHLDPIEKKPLYHVYPGTSTVSIGMTGCNLFCDFCQNHVLVCGDVPVRESLTSRDVLEALDTYASPIVSYTYSEPIVWQESVLPLATAVHDRGLLNVFVTNGTFSRQSRDSLRLLIDALNIDLKGDERFYREVCHAKGAYQAVLDSIDFWVNHTQSIVEVTTLIIEGFHTPSWVRKTGLLLQEIGVQVWHLSRFFPAFPPDGRQGSHLAFSHAGVLSGSSEGRHRSCLPREHGVSGGRCSHLPGMFLHHSPKCAQRAVRFVRTSVVSPLRLSSVRPVRCYRRLKRSRTFSTTRMMGGRMISVEAIVASRLTDTRTPKYRIGT